MNSLKIKQKNSLNIAGDPTQRGSAIVIALFVLALISVFVAFALSRTSAEALAVGNETAEGRTLYAAQGSLEMMSRNFNKVFERRLNPSAADLVAVQTGVVPGLQPQYTFFQELPLQTSIPGAVVLSGGPFSGLFAIRDNWRLRTTATDTRTGVQTQLTRNILNNRIPIFQFGIFYNDDLELFRPPRFSFGGRVHSNGNFFVSPGADGIFFDSRVTAARQIVTQTWRNWNTGDSLLNQTFIRNASGVFEQLLPTEGSVLNTTAGAVDNIFEFPPAIPAPVPAPNLDLPPSRLNPTWAAVSAKFDGNLQSQVPRLNLPLGVGAAVDLIEMVKRGKEIASVAGGDLFQDNAGVTNPVTAADVDNDILRSERFANKTGIRVSLADSQAKLPGCASGVGTAPVGIVAPARCGIRLDGDITGRIAALQARGYQPNSMRNVVGGPLNAYVPTRVNGERLFTGGGREVWIKIETVSTNAATGAIITVDITEDILSLGVTQEAPASIPITGPVAYAGTPSINGTPTAPSANITAGAPQAASTFPDSRSIVKLQTFSIPGPAIPVPGPAITNNHLFSYGGATPANVVRRFSNADNAKIAAGCPTALPTPVANRCTPGNLDPNGSLENTAHLKLATVNGTPNDAIVPFPIEMFDMREGFYFDSRTAAFYPTFNTQITRNGVMSMIDIDVANLRRFLRGDFNGLFPVNTPFAIANAGVGLVNANIPQVGGWVLYVSDRRGDGNFDGEYDMEDIYGAAPGNDGATQLGEDLDGPLVVAGQPAFIPRFGAGVLDARYFNNLMAGCLGGLPNCEAANYSDTWFPDRAAVSDHPYYRRGVRLINGTTLPGVYDALIPANTRGFTVASENGIYVRGNYNATGAANPPAIGNTPFNQYFPFNSPTHIPASIVADAVTILSNAWNDGASFRSPVITPFDQSARLAATTQMRFAMISGDTIATRDAGVNQGGISPKLNGGVHNFKRFLERWTGQRLDYAGSLINLYNSRNNNGSFKCCTTVYNPPIRNWVFDSTFLDPGRLPPGTPYFQFVQTTGFQRTND